MIHRVLIFSKKFSVVTVIISIEVIVIMGNEEKLERQAQKAGEGMFMTRSIPIQENSLAEGMKKYIAKIIEEGIKSPEKTREEAIEALKRTGVLSEDGKTKDEIVSWE